MLTSKCLSTVRTKRKVPHAAVGDTHVKVSQYGAVRIPIAQPLANKVLMIEHVIGYEGLNVRDVAALHRAPPHWIYQSGMCNHITGFIHKEATAECENMQDDKMGEIWKTS